MGVDEELGSLAMAASLELELLEAKAERPPMKDRVKRCHQLLNRGMKVGVSDGRFFIGKFHCLDKQGNLILYDTLECRPIHPPSRDVAVEPSLPLLSSPLLLPPLSSQSPSTSASSLEQRNLGLVLIPARCRTSCLVEGSLEEQLTLLSLQEN